jgi:spermidine synthase
MSLGWTWIIGAYFATFLAVSVLLGTSRYLVGGMVILVAVFLFQSSTWDRDVSTWFYNQKYGSRVQGVAWSEQTPYQKIEVLDLGGGEHMLLLNGRRQFTEGPRRDYSYFVAEYPAKLLESPRVCVLGCSSMSTVGRIGEHAKTIRIVDLDAGVFAVSKRFFAEYNQLNELHNWAFTDDDAKHYMAETSETYDLILHDIAPVRTRQAALTCTAEFFALVKARLAPQGVFSMASRTPLDSGSLYGRRLIATLTHVFDRYFILEHGRSVYFYGGGKDMPRWTREHLIQSIEHEGRSYCRLRSGLDLDALVRGDDVITINDVAGLIYE